MSKEFILPIGTVVLSVADLQGNILRYNAGFRDASGYTDDELQGKPHNLLRHPDMPKAVFQDLWTALQAGNTWFGVIKNKRKDDDYYWVAANFSPIQESNNITGYISVRYPATREQIAQAEALYASIRLGKQSIPKTHIQTSYNPIALGIASAAVISPLALLGIHSSIELALPLAASLSLSGLGYLVHQIITAQRITPSINKAIDNLANQQLQAPIEDHTALGNIFNYLRIRTAEYMAFLYDAHRNEQIMLTALNTASTSIMTLDPYFNIININENLRQLFISRESKFQQDFPHFSATKIVGQNMDVFHKNPHHQRELLKHITTPYQANIRVADLVLQLTVIPIFREELMIGYVVEWLDRTIEATIVTELGQVFEGVAKGDFSHKIESDADGIYLQIKRDVNNAVDVTKKLFAQLDLVMQDLSKAKTLAEQASHAKSLFIHNMTHELRTPLNAIIGFVQLLKMDSLNNSQQESLDHVMQSAEHLLGIVNQVLDISNISTGQIELTQVNFSLRDVIDRTVLGLSKSLEDKKLLLKLDISKNLPEFCTGDPIRLEQLLNNFLDNAIKFTEQGKITLSIHPSEDKNQMIFAIQDTGIGMSQETQQKLYASFSQADESVSRQYGGIGLGLAISKGLIEQMGGAIKIDSQLDTGTTVTFTLPINHNVHQEAPLISQVEIAEVFLQDIHDKKVLLVEDNKINQMVAIKILEKIGITPDVANNGLEAMQMRNQTKYDLILLDVQMPIKDGYTTISEIRAEEQKTQQHQLVIGLSANGLKGDIDKAKRLGMDDYITKPIDFKLLQEKLHHWLLK